MIPQNTTPIGPPPTPPPEPSGRREGLLVALAVLLGAAAVLGGLVGYQRFVDDGTEVAADGGESDEAGDAPIEESTTTTVPTDSAGATETDDAEEDEAGAVEDAPPAEPLVESVPCPEQYSADICDAADFVQQARGRPFKEFPNIELLDDAPFDAALLEDFEESRAELVEDERLMKSLGLISTDLDLFQTFRDLLEVGVVGFYDPETGRLVVRGGEFDLYGLSVLVHELVHAFDDQWFDLSRDDFDSADAEYGYLAVIEGNASRVENLWRDSLSSQELEDLTVQELGSLAPEDLDRLLALPRILINLQISPYEDGELYVSSLVAEGGEEAVDERFVDPPESSEQVLQFGTSADELAVIDVEPPPVDGPVSADGTIGELLMRFWLGGAAGDGWGGDRFVTWSDGDLVCTTIDIVADSDQDLDEIERAAEVWTVDAEDRRSVERVDSVDRSKLRVTGCY